MFKPQKFWMRQHKLLVIVLAGLLLDWLGVGHGCNCGSDWFVCKGPFSGLGGCPCDFNEQCWERSCVAGTCGTPSCTNGAQDGDERRVDCGGRCGGCLTLGQACRFDDECISGTCFLTYHADAGPHESAITGICTPSASNDLALDRRDMQSIDAAHDGFGGILNDAGAIDQDADAAVGLE